MIRASGFHLGCQTAFTNGAHDAVADVPVVKGGAGEGFGPHELLEAALATCMAMTVTMSATEHGLPLTAVRCEVRLDRSAPAGVALTYTLAFDGELSEGQAERLREAAGRCPVARTLTGGLAVRPASIREDAR